MRAVSDVRGLRGVVQRLARYGALIVLVGLVVPTTANSADATLVCGDRLAVKLSIPPSWHHDLQVPVGHETELMLQPPAREGFKARLVAKRCVRRDDTPVTPKSVRESMDLALIMMGSGQLEGRGTMPKASVQDIRLSNALGSYIASEHARPGSGPGYEMFGFALVGDLMFEFTIWSERGPETGLNAVLGVMRSASR